MVDCGWDMAAFTKQRDADTVWLCFLSPLLPEHQDTNIVIALARKSFACLVDTKLKEGDSNRSHEGYSDDRMGG